MWPRVALEEEIDAFLLSLQSIHIKLKVSWQIRENKVFTCLGWWEAGC